MMRLRLSVQRHRLPPANVLWSVPANASPQAYTISRLLEDVNAILPLEAEHWGLEDYVVEVGGFECLHFTPVAQALKDDDELVIRPLLTAEVRSRTLSGRYQISGAGQHLVDGVPFGKPCLRPPTNRPPITIPPCKRPRMLEETTGGADEEGAIGLITASGEVQVPPTGTKSMGRYNAVNNPPAQYRDKPHEKAVHFDDAVAYEESTSDEEDDGDFNPNEAGAVSDMSMDDDESPDDSTSDSGSDSDSDSGSNTDSSSSSSGEESDSSQSSGPEVVPSKPVPAHNVPPYAGKKATKARNQRRIVAKKRRQLVESGLLPAQSTLKDTRQHLRQDETELDADTAKPVAQAQKSSHKRKRGGTELMPEERLQAGDELEERRKTLLAALNLDATSSETTKVGGLGESAEVMKQPPVQEPVQEPARKRLRPDTSAITRILSHQTRPLDKRTPKAKAAPVEESQVASDPELWKSKINYTAFECWFEEYDELSAPPFPFQQHWDPASKEMHEKNKPKKRKRPAPDEVDEVAEFIAEINELDYGDPSTSTISGDTDKPETDIDTAAAIESQLREDVATATRTDLPSLPDDVDTLPALSESDVKAGAIVVFKTFHLDMSTMAPEISGYKTAIVEAEGDSENGGGIIKLRLAERDIVRKEKTFDKFGNRTFDRADNFRIEDSDGEDGDGHEESVLQHAFSELLEAKLLKASD